MPEPAVARKTIIADAGPLIALASSELLPVLELVFEEILLPKIVAFECRRDLVLPGASEIHRAIEEGRLRIVESPKSTFEFPASLGPGERAAIVLAAAKGLGILVDDRPARRFAQRMGVPVLGTGGLLLIAKRRGHIENIGPSLAKLRGKGYRISQRLVEELLRRAGEG